MLVEAVSTVMDVYRRLKPYYWKHRYIGVAMLFFVVCIAALGIVRPNLQRLIVDDVIVAGHQQMANPNYTQGLPPAVSKLPLLALSIVGVSVICGFCQYMRRYLGHVFGTNAIYELRNALYERLQSFSFKYYDTAQTGDLMSRLTGDVEVFRRFLAFGFAGLLEIILVFCFGLTTMLIMNWRLTLLVLIFMPFLAALTNRFRRQIHPSYTRVREAMADMSTLVQESITGIRTVKSFTREPHQINLFADRVRILVRCHMDAIRVSSRFFPLMELMGSIGVLILIYFGGRAVITEQMTIGSLVAFFSLIWFVIGPVQQLGYEVNNYTNSIAAGERLLEVLNTPRDIRDKPHATPIGRINGRVEFKNVTFAYSKDIVALKNINLCVEPGTVLGVLGPTGAGKSTLVSLIPRYYDVTSGSVLVDGRDVRCITLDSLRQQVGIVFQDTFLFSTTIKENISFARRHASMAEVETAARLASAHDFIMETPDGYDTLVGERGLGLSGGQKQRIAIARAILADPRILILDDATASVDMETEHEIQEALKTLMRGRTTIIIAHRVSSVMNADNIIVLDHGGLVEQGTHVELLALDGIYRRVYDVQFADYTSMQRQMLG
jgi:ATP-binding cassette subfamily B multidrug efflux pump